MRRAAPRAEGVYGQLVERYLGDVDRVYRRCRHLPFCPPGAAFEECPRPSPVAKGLAAGEPVELQAWYLPGRPADYGLDAYDRVCVYPDDRIGPAAPLTTGPRPPARRRT